MATKPVQGMTDEEGRVLAAVSLVEADGGQGYVQQIAAAAELPVDETRRVLSRLLNPLDLVREVPTDRPDFGPLYTVKER